MVLISIATYNEIENLPQLVEGIFHFVPDCHLLIVDDDSPDGTGDWCDQLARQDERVRCIHLSVKLGLGSATVEGLRYALNNDYEFVITMDADLSHQPSHLPDILAGMNPENGGAVDVMIGSRYVDGGGIAGWPLHRRCMSRAVNWYARILLRLKTRDNSGAFRCYRCEALRRLDFGLIQSRGYSFFEEILYHLSRLNCRFAETPIVFVDRELGKSKINHREMITALRILTCIGLFGVKSDQSAEPPMR